MKRTKLADRLLPEYTTGEEIFNMVSHITGGAFGIVVTVLCIVFSTLHHNLWGLGSGIFYGLMMIFLYCMSSIYHGLKPGFAKKVMQVLDHCSIFALITGTYMPILCCGIRKYSFVLFIVILVILIAGTAVGVVFTAIDFHKYKILSYASYFVIGWCALFALKPMYISLGKEFIIWLLAGGISYTSGMIFFGLGVRHRYCHSIFHLFILAGSVLQFVAIFKFCILI